jgi:ABC-type antimicrobial peptide transport system permease subunit
VSIKIAPDHVAETLQYFRKAWETTFPEHLYDYQFLDVALNRQYGFFDYILGFLEPAAFLAIFIGCMGLYGLISFMAVQRTKEVGIRKVMGATVSNIMIMFTKESLWLIALSFLIAAPLGYFGGQVMLMEFPERVIPGPHLFVLTLLASLLIAWLTIGYQSYKAALANPTDSLRHE